MMPERSLVAERPLARHAADLVRPGPGPTELAPALARATERMARSMRGALALLLGGEPPMVECGPSEELTLEGLTARVTGLAAWLVARSGSALAVAALALWTWQLVLNAVWSPASRASRNTR